MSAALAELPVVVIGAGPVGLAAAVHLKEQGLTPLVLEAGASAGAAVRAWGHTQLFSPWRYNIDEAARRLLEPTGWTAPDEESLPIGHQLADHYLEPLAEALGDSVRTDSRVIAVTRQGIDKTRTTNRENIPFLRARGIGRRQHRGRVGPQRIRRLGHLEPAQPRGPIWAAHCRRIHGTGAGTHHPPAASGHRSRPREIRWTACARCRGRAFSSQHAAGPS